MKVSLIGNRKSLAEPGNLARAIIDNAADLSDVDVSIDSVPTVADIVIYCRSQADDFSSVVDYCEEHTTPLLILSTVADISLLEGREVDWLQVANTNQKVVDYMQRISEDMASIGSVNSFHLEEHHQAGKNDVSGTARKICEQNGLDEGAIISVRDIDETNTRYGLDLKQGDLYAVHEFWAEDKSGNRTPTRLVKVFGHEDYAQGAIKIARSLVA